MNAAHPANHLQLPGVCLLRRLGLCLPFSFSLLSSGARCTDRTLWLFLGLDRGGRPVDDGASGLHERQRLGEYGCSSSLSRHYMSFKHILASTM